VLRVRDVAEDQEGSIAGRNGLSGLEENVFLLDRGLWEVAEMGCVPSS
jgi:hypothetical protein